MRSKRRRTAACLATAALAAAVVPVVSGTAIADPAPLPPVVAEPVSPPPPTAEQIRHAQAEAMRRKLVLVAKSKIRTAHYAHGATGPRAFDCSGFTMWLYKTVAHRRLDHYSGAQLRETRRVSRKHLLPGDLLFWGPGGSQHVSMYIGRGKMIGANNPRSGIRIESINAPWWQGKFAGAGRVIMA